MTAPAPSLSIDLLAWPAVEAARAELIAAEEARAVAEQRWRWAPHGQVQDRLRAFQEATHRALNARRALERITAEAVH